MEVNCVSTLAELRSYFVLGLERGWKWDVNGVKFPKGLLNLFDMKIAPDLCLSAVEQWITFYSIQKGKYKYEIFPLKSISFWHPFSHQSIHSISLHFS